VHAPGPPRPFLKWAGGKRQLLPQLRQFFPDTIPRYFEPFLGSAAVFFDLCGSGRLRPAAALLSDNNADLIGTYLRVCDATDALLATLTHLAQRHQRDARTQYYRVRDEQFNPRRRKWLEAGDDAARYPVELAAMFVYLNRTGYNGLFRLNAAGEFNVPAGRYDAPQIVNSDRIQAAAGLLSQACIRRIPFAEAVQDARSGDVVYFDPPYAPLSRTASFRSYTAAGFSEADQTRLRDEVVRLATHGVRVILSNSTAPQIVTLYEADEVRRAGLRCYRVSARRAINTNAKRRGPIDELVVTNAP
jgi:DNA adenine methylase